MERFKSSPQNKRDYFSKLIFHWLFFITSKIVFYLNLFHLFRTIKYQNIECVGFVKGMGFAFHNVAFWRNKEVYKGKNIDEEFFQYKSCVSHYHSGANPSRNDWLYIFAPLQKWKRQNVGIFSRYRNEPHQIRNRYQPILTVSIINIGSCRYSPSHNYDRK